MLDPDFDHSSDRFAPRCPKEPAQKPHGRPRCSIGAKQRAAGWPQQKVSYSFSWPKYHFKSIFEVELTQTKNRFMKFPISLLHCQLQSTPSEIQVWMAPCWVPIHPMGGQSDWLRKRTQEKNSQHSIEHSSFCQTIEVFYIFFFMTNFWTANVLHRKKTCRKDVTWCGM